MRKLFIAILLVLSVQPVRADGVVGTGTSASCKNGDVHAALAGGGDITFNCGRGVATISITSPLIIREDTIIDGAGSIVLSGMNRNQIIIVQPGVRLELRNLVFENGLDDTYTPSPRGGAIQNNGGSLIISNSIFRGNAAINRDRLNSGSGGAIYSEGGSVTITDSLFLGNRTLGDGGAIYNVDGSLDIQRSRFILNSARERGGAIIHGEYLTSPENITVIDSFFSLNSARAGGAIIANQGTNNLISNSQFDSNIAQAWAGGIYAAASDTFEVIHSRFTGNTSFRHGGALVNANGRMTMIGNSLMRNRAYWNGGGVYSNTYLDVETSTFAYNSAGELGGGLYSHLAADITLSILNSTFSANAAERGGGLYDKSRNAGIYRTNIAYSTFAYNRGGGIQSQYGHYVLQGSIIAYSQGDWNCRPAPDDRYYSMNFPDASCGGHNVDPYLMPLADNGGITLTHALSIDSPAIDAVSGMPLLIGLGTELDPLRCTTDFDQRNLTRPVNVTGADVALCDMGAYEYDAMPTRFEVVSNPEPESSSDPVSCSNFRPTSPLDGFPNGVATFYWDAAPGATAYRVVLFNEIGQQVAAFDQSSASTTVNGDVGSGAVGSGFNFSWEVLALYNGRTACTTNRVSIPRSSGEITTSPQCGNGIQEAGENPNNCPNGY